MYQTIQRIISHTVPLCVLVASTDRIWSVDYIINKLVAQCVLMSPVSHYFRTV